MGVGLSPRGGRRMAGKSRVSREAHARFCERFGVKFPGATRPLAEGLDNSKKRNYCKHTNILKGTPDNEESNWC